MGRWSHLDTDEERLPDGMERIGYDADTEVYTFRSENGSIWESAPGNRYGPLFPVSRPSPKSPDSTPASPSFSTPKRSASQLVTSSSSSTSGRRRPSVRTGSLSHRNEGPIPEYEIPDDVKDFLEAPKREKSKKQGQSNDEQLSEKKPPISPNNKPLPSTPDEKPTRLSRATTFSSWQTGSESNWGGSTEKGEEDSGGEYRLSGGAASPRQERRMTMTPRTPSEAWGMLFGRARGALESLQHESTVRGRALQRRATLLVSGRAGEGDGGENSRERRGSM